MEKQAKLRNEAYVNAMASAVAKAEEKELSAAQQTAQAMEAEAISNDELQRLERLEAHYEKRAEWIKRFAGVTAQEFDKLKQCGIAEADIAEVAKDSKACAKAVDLFKALANMDADLIEDQPLLATIKALYAGNTASEQTEWNNKRFGNEVRTTLAHTGTRQYDMVRNMLTRFGLLERYKADGTLIPNDASARGIETLQLQTKNKAWKRIVKTLDKQ